MIKTLNKRKMEDFKNNIVVYSGVCRCCFQDEKRNTFVGLWDQHLYDGNVEVYGEMITECFLIPWTQPDNPEANVEQICVDCVSKVRDAFNFKQQLVALEDQLAQHFEQVNEEEDDKSDLTTEVHIDGKKQKLDTKLEHQKDHVSEVCDQSEDKDESDSQDQTVSNEENFMEILENSDPEYEYIELEEEDEDFYVNKNDTDDTKEWAPQTYKKKIPNKNGEGSRIVKNYRQIDMDEAVRCALEGTLTHAQAAAKYGVPKKTVYAKVKKIKAQREEEERMGIKKLLNQAQGDINKGRINNLINEIMKILTYTNATPFKTTTSSFGCVYCNFVLKATLFEDQEELRAHTRVEHVNERIQAVEIFMKPNLYNEVLKVDIYNLVCTVCCEAISGWMEMFEHLNKAHDVSLDEAYTRVIPYVLDASNCRCALCKEKFNNFHHLDAHMNSHYNNYVCADCGDTFLSYSRIKAHIKVHKTGRFPCDYPGCGKIFNLEKYRKKHYMLIHTDEKLVRCQYCDLKFHDEVQRHSHIKERHKEKVKYITCDICGMVFDWKINYYEHMRTKHKDDHSMKCKYCDVLCTNRALLMKHLRTHGDLDIYCDICNKSFLAVRYMKQHKKRIHGIISQNWA